MRGNTSTDLRSRRTRRWLQEALLSLMKEKPFKEIQITEIADRAEVSRPAFYLHFRSKEELLLSHVDAVLEAFRTEFSNELAAGNFDLRKFSVLLFQYWEKNARILQMVIEAGTQQILLERLRGYFGSMMVEFAGGRQFSKEDQQRIEYIVDFVAGGTYMLLTSWVTNAMPYSAEEMGNLLFDLVLPREKPQGSVSQPALPNRQVLTCPPRS